MAVVRAARPRRTATRMMPLPDHVMPRHAFDPWLPAETQRAVRWEGITGTLPVPTPTSWRLRAQRALRAWWSRPRGIPTPTARRGAHHLVPRALHPPRAWLAVRPKAAPQARRKARPPPQART